MCILSIYSFSVQLLENFKSVTVSDGTFVSTLPLWHEDNIDIGPGALVKALREELLHKQVLVQWYGGEFLLGRR